jgi:hypothetical protein
LSIDRPTYRAQVLVGSDTEEVTGSNPVAPTTVLAGQSAAGPELVVFAASMGRGGAACPP